MLPITQEWVSKAEGDYDVVCLLLRSRKASRLDPLCFHAQQCVEKYLKAILTEAGISFPKTHDLPALLQLAAAVQPGWSALAGAFAILSISAISPRYPGTSSTPANAREAVRICRRFRLMARGSLGI